MLLFIEVWRAMPHLSVQDSGIEGGESVLRASLDRAAFHGG